MNWCYIFKVPMAELDSFVYHHSFHQPLQCQNTKYIQSGNVPSQRTTFLSPNAAVAVEQWQINVVWTFFSKFSYKSGGKLSPPCAAWNMNVTSEALATILHHKDKGHLPRITEQKTGRRLDPWWFWRVVISGLNSLLLVTLCFLAHIGKLISTEIGFNIFLNVCC